MKITVFRFPVSKNIFGACNLPLQEKKIILCMNFKFILVGGSNNPNLIDDATLLSIMIYLFQSATSGIRLLTLRLRLLILNNFI